MQYRHAWTLDVYQQYPVPHPVYRCPWAVSATTSSHPLDPESSTTRLTDVLAKTKDQSAQPYETPQPPLGGTSFDSR